MAKAPHGKKAKSKLTDKEQSERLNKPLGSSMLNESGESFEKALRSLLPDREKPERR